MKLPQYRNDSYDKIYDVLSRLLAVAPRVINARFELLLKGIGRRENRNLLRSETGKRSLGAALSEGLEFRSDEDAGKQDEQERQGTQKDLTEI